MKNTTRKQFVRSFFASSKCNPGSPPGPAKAEPPLMFAVVSPDVAVFGLGSTAESAMDNARRRLSNLPKNAIVARCSARYALAVEKKGGCAIVPGKFDEHGTLDVPTDQGTGSGAVERFEEVFERLRDQVEEQNATIYGKRELMKKVAREGGVIGNSTVFTDKPERM
jgi:hypothetical protein